MKQILLVPSIILMLMLSGCTVSPSMLGGNFAGIGSGVSPDNQISPTINASDTTGSIVPSGEEGVVVDLPDSSAQMQASSGIQGATTSPDTADQLTTQEEQAASAQERHRRELINRGDLKEGQPLPVE